MRQLTAWQKIFILALLIGIFYNTRPGSMPLSPAGQLASVSTPSIFEEPLEPIGPRTQDSACQPLGPLPDPECTPGAVFSDKTLDDICVSGYSKTVRDVSVSLKKQVYRSYGITYPPPFGTYELDHLVPLAIGGSNDIANLSPVRGEPRPGFREKNIAAVYLRDEICAGRIALEAAQQLMANNWLAVHEIIPPKRASEIQKKYPSWADRK